MTPSNLQHNPGQPVEPHFDQLARALASGASRRQLLKGFAAGLGAGLLAVWGGGRATPSNAWATAHAAAGDGTLFMPALHNGIAAEICPTASTCQNRVYCSLTEDCRCIASAEGQIRCGKVPSCSAQRCQTSADCANLGEGYFCDSPGSGCCDDEQRCIAPCDAVAPIITGTWTGTLTYAQQAIGIRFILQLADDVLTGRMLMQDPESATYLETGEIHYGDLTRDTGYWTTESGAEVIGTFGNEGFSGTFTFPFTNGEEGFDAELTMTRTGD